MPAFHPRSRVPYRTGHGVRAVISHNTSCRIVVHTLRKRRPGRRRAPRLKFIHHGVRAITKHFLSNPPARVFWSRPASTMYLSLLAVVWDTTKHAPSSVGQRSSANITPRRWRPHSQQQPPRREDTKYNNVIHSYGGCGGLQHPWNTHKRGVRNPPPVDSTTSAPLLHS